MRVVIADDAVIVREGIARLLSERGLEIVGQAGDVAGLMDLVKRQQPDVAIIDIRMPPTHTDEGLRAAHAIRMDYPQTAALVLSQLLNPGYAVRLIRDSPAHVGYLLKERVGHVDELVDAVARVARGLFFFAPFLGGGGGWWGGGWRVRCADWRGVGGLLGGGEAGRSINGGLE